MKKQYYVYIMTNKRNTVIYTGMTGDLEHRIYEHKNKLIKGFTSKYKVDKLVYYEEFESAYEAIQREKQIKGWRRSWKIDLIKRDNTKFNDLANEWFEKS
jgi:putative endonuclease